MKKNLILLLVALTCAIGHLGAQSASFDDVRKIYLQNSGVISNGNEVQGYFTFFFVDKTSGKENRFALNILDNNLNPTHHIEFTKPRAYFLLESAYNGENFCFSFLNYKGKSIEYLIFDKEGKETGTYKVTDLSKGELNAILMIVREESNIYTGGLTAVPGVGFVRYGMDKDKGVRMEMFNSSGRKIWNADSKATTKKSYESVIPMYADENVVASMLTVRPKLLSQKDFKMEVIFHDAKTGKERFRVNADAAKYQHFPIGISHDPTTDGYFIYGEYFGASDNLYKDQSKGFYVKEISSNGDEDDAVYNSWSGDISRVIPMNKKGRFDKNAMVAIHKMVRTADGKIYAIGEQFKKSASAVGIASTVLAASGGNSSNVAVVKITLLNMMVFQFNKNFEIESVDIIEKDPTGVELPAGFGTQAPTLLAHYLRSYGQFDYAFTALSGDGNMFNAAYVNFDREKGAKNNYVVGNIVRMPDSDELAVDRIKLTDRPTNFLVMPGKPGYVAIIKYFKKEKKLDFSLEKLNL